MYLGIDVGGTKTLVATLDQHGVITEKVKFPTPKTYPDFLTELAATISKLQVQEFRAGGIGIPATIIDREHGVGKRFGNLPWRNVPIQHDVERIAHCPIVLENDAKMAGLSESMVLGDAYARVLYVTVSTGIGFSLVVDHVIDTNVGDGGGRAMLIEHRGKMTPWEEFASGRAIVARYHKKAFEIEDEETWHKISRDIARGMIELIAVTEPDVIVIGGGVGTYFSRFGKMLAAELKNYHLPIVPIPPLKGAQRAEEAVVYGCYDLAKQVFGHARANS
jgi:predicted NBD/HSP70 family sugar kinase